MSLTAKPIQSNNVPSDLVSTRQFTWLPRTRQLIAECSDLRDLTIRPIIGNTLGFRLQSQRTGTIIDVVKFFEERDREDELVATHFKPLNNTIDLTIVILND